MTRKMIAVAAMALSLCGCVSAQQRAKITADNQARYDAQDDAQCRSYGAAAGSDAYVNCRVSLATQRANAKATAETAATAAGHAAALNFMNQQIHQTQQPNH